MKTNLALLAAALLLAGCATMDKNQCRNADWYAIGLEDGGQGRTLDRLGERRRACAEHGVQPDGERYAAGRNEGLKSFCTYDRGYGLGRAGKAYYGVCPEPSATNFVAGYRSGKELYDLGKRLDAVNADIKKTKAGLSEPGVSPSTRGQLAERLEDLSREAQYLEQQIARAQSRR
jgi:hypothetical protein